MITTDIDDLFFSKAGDLLGYQGDLLSARQAAEYPIVQDIRSRICGNLADWRSHPTITANLTQYLGGPNSKDVAKQIESSCRSSILKIDGLTSKDLTELRVFPLSNETLGIYIKVRIYDVQKRVYIYLNDIYTTTNSSINPGLVASN